MTKTLKTKLDKNIRPTRELTKIRNEMSIRWNPFRKAVVLHAVMNAHISEAEALSEYGLTPEETEAWYNAVTEQGLAGLRTAKRVRA